MIHPQHVSYSCIVGTKAVLKGYDANWYVSFEKYKRGFMSDKQMQFELIRPGLTRGANTASLMSAKTPGWYVRSYIQAKLELRPNSSNQQDFDIDVTFKEHSNTFYQGTVAFESVSKPGYYLRHYGAEYSKEHTVYFSKFEDNVEFNQSASFVVLSSNNSRKRRTADNGKKIHCRLCLETPSIIKFCAL